MNTASARPFPWLTAIIVLLSAVLAAILGALITGGSNDPWYVALNKPGFTPPDIAFAIVWPYLFANMIVGAILVLHRARSPHRISGPMGVYFTMLAVNVGWSLFFFGFHEPAIALGVIAALWLQIVAMMEAFWRHSRLAALLQTPYLVWVSFALVLNAAILLANPSA